MELPLRSPSCSLPLLLANAGAFDGGRLEIKCCTPSFQCGRPGGEQNIDTVVSCLGHSNEQAGTSDGQDAVHLPPFLDAPMIRHHSRLCLSSTHPSPPVTCSRFQAFLQCSPAWSAAEDSAQALADQEFFEFIIISLALIGAYLFVAPVSTLPWDIHHVSRVKDSSRFRTLIAAFVLGLLKLRAGSRPTPITRSSVEAWRHRIS